MNQTINISLPKTMMADIKDMIAAGHFATVSEAIRAGINKIKTEFHPKYYTVMKLNPKAEKRVEKSLAEYRQGKAIRVTNFADLLK